MKNTLADLNNYLFGAIEEIMDAETPEELEQATKKGTAISKISSQIVSTANTELKAIQIQAEYGDGRAFEVPRTLIESKGQDHE